MTMKWKQTKRFRYKDYESETEMYWETNESVDALLREQNLNATDFWADEEVYTREIEINGNSNWIGINESEQ